MKDQPTLDQSAQTRSSWLEDPSWLRHIFETAAMALVIDRDGFILELNKKFCEISDHCPEEILGKDVRDVFSASAIWADVLAGKNWTGEIEGRAKTGKAFVLYVTAVPLAREGSVEAVAMVGFDATPHQQVGEDNAMWLRSHLWLERVKHDYLERRREDRAMKRPLSLREEQVLRLVAEGFANKNIAVRLKISVRTVEIHRAHLLKKLGLKTTAGLVKYAIENGYSH